MIAKECSATNCWSYEDVSDELFHPAFSVVTGVVNVGNGTGAGHLIFCGQVFQVFSGADEAARRIFIVRAGAQICGLLAVARHVSSMRRLAAGSIAALFFLCDPRPMLERTGCVAFGLRDMTLLAWRCG